MGTFQNQNMFGNKTSTPNFGTSFQPNTFSSPSQPPLQSTFSFGNTENTGNKSLFGFNTNSPIATFGSNTNTTLFNSNFQPPQNTVGQSELDLFNFSIIQPSLCNDDRDVIISRWNQLQAMWGCGTGLSKSGKSIYTPENILCRFKAVSFNKIPNCEDTDGFVSLLIKSPFKDIALQKTQIHQKLNQLVNSSMHSVIIEDIRPAIKSFNDQLLLPAPTAPKPFGFIQQPVAPAVATLPVAAEYIDVFIKISENIGGITRFMPASAIANQFKNEQLKSKLASELNVIDVVAHLSLNATEISDYLNGPAPRGLQAEIWEKARQQCARSVGLVPVPIIGMRELKARIKGQVEFAQAQLTTIRSEAETVSEMKTKVISMTGKIDQLKRKEIELSNRILKIMCTQEIFNKQGYTLSAEEETLKCSLDKLYNQISGPFGIKSRLHEILSAPKVVPDSSKINSRLSYNNLSNESMEELKEYFFERQKSIKEMMALIRENIGCLNIMENL